MLQSLKLNLQPFFLLDDSLKNSVAYVYINNHKYRMVNLMEAIDLCFKSYYALDAIYPRDCEAIW